MTPYSVIYSAFLSKQTDDEWENWTIHEINADFRQMLEAGLPYFKFPRVSLARDDKGFKEDLNDQEVQIIACYMKCEWLNRIILSWENVKNLYTERDFSQANLLDKFTAMLKAERKQAEKLEAIYYRSVERKPFRYRELAKQS
jgi:hypothetical protein